eukprot:CAMPEP_0116135142 /NCGR_PEP_ID=MMETSP0329-20121206/11033_1 /TAXON_ID=697910 /ORGANISM="Pseudo-nitzschia arenysensis, Strain B593" /LENGTH=264 /DNA_ID=CAMNT_0003629923 /DNA_START=56 /DNA_END=850 /DNA_ORIENTATION=+
MASTTATRSGSRQLMSVLTTPSKIANALDWRKATGGAIATLDIHADRIGVRISQHPQNNSKRRKYSLPVSPRGRTRIPESTRQQLSQLVHDHKVCGFIVSWPIQEDTGLMGAACGRTLYAIEELFRNDIGSSSSSSSSNNNPETNQGLVFTPNRPLCLWEAAAGAHKMATADSFGRSSLYARTSDKTEHLASKEQYHQDEAVVVSEIWDDFVKTHWPEIDRAKKEKKNLSTIQNHSQEEVSATPLWDGGDTSSGHQRQATMGGA